VHADEPGASEGEVEKHRRSQAPTLRHQ
jgi:hypothetical protein